VDPLPVQFVETVVIEPKLVSNFADDRPVDLGTDLLFGMTIGADF
jgi:hypothetical protein